MASDGIMKRSFSVKCDPDCTISSRQPLCALGFDSRIVSHIGLIFHALILVGASPPRGEGGELPLLFKGASFSCTFFGGLVPSRSRMLHYAEFE